jgi:hypothetical protein
VGRLWRARVTVRSPPHHRDVTAITRPVMAPAGRAHDDARADGAGREHQ